MTRGRMLSIPSLLLVVAFVGGCTMAKISGKGPIPLLLNNPPKKVQVIGHLLEKKMVTFDYTGSYDVYEIIAERLANTKADAVINLTITIKSDVGTFFVNLVTLGLANARTVQVEGDLVKLPEGLSSLDGRYELLTEAKDFSELRARLKELDRHVRVASIVRTADGFAVLGERN